MQPLDSKDKEIEESESHDKSKYQNGKNELLETFLQNCVICLNPERPSVYALHQCAHQNSRESCCTSSHGNVSRGVEKCDLCRAKQN